MREALKNAVQSAILFECQLPHQESGLGKSCLSSQNDICFNNTDPQEIAKVIYNGIVEFPRVKKVQKTLDNLMPKISLAEQVVSSNIIQEELST